MSLKSAVNKWAVHIGNKERATLKALLADRVLLEDAFACNLHFGTGGLRGKVGIGPNRLNVWTVGKATQGLADYLNARFSQSSVIIARDSRRGGEAFVRRTAEVLAANGVTAFVFDGFASTPELSFAAHHLGCSAGVCVTASHNPAEYNGYKVYGPDGCQITTEAAHGIQARIDEVDVFDGVSRMGYEDAVARGAVRTVGHEVRESYLAEVAEQLEGVDCSGFSVAYTPLNGTGGLYVPGLLGRMGVEACVVPEQAEPDGEFPTCPKPNPEVPEAMGAVIALARERRCALALATDPDADRLGVAVSHGGAWRLLSGNEVGELLLDWLLARAAGRGEDMARVVCATTVVSAPRADDIAKAWGCQLRRTLTGFKFVGEQVGLLDAAGEAGRFLFGLEESCGYLKGSYVRDKDGVEALALVCEMAADYAARGMDLVDALEDLGRRVGFQAGHQVTVPFEGADGQAAMAALMSGLRACPPALVSGLAVESVIDYADGAPMPVVNSLPGDAAQALPPTDMLEWRLSGGARVLVRPSGTEPKLKAYCFARGESEADAERAADALAGGVCVVLEERG